MSLEEESEEYDPERQEEDAGIGRFTFLHFFFFFDNRMFKKCSNIAWERDQLIC